MADSQRLSFPTSGAVPAGCIGVELKQRAKPIPNCRGLEGQSKKERSKNKKYRIKSNLHFFDGPDWISPLQGGGWEKEHHNLCSPSKVAPALLQLSLFHSLTPLTSSLALLSLSLSTLFSILFFQSRQSFSSTWQHSGSFAVVAVDLFAAALPDTRGVNSISKETQTSSAPRHSLLVFPPRPASQFFRHAPPFLSYFNPKIWCVVHLGSDSYPIFVTAVCIPSPFFRLRAFVNRVTGGLLLC